MPRLFAVCTLPPWPIRDGYSLRVANLLPLLAKRWDITLLAPLGSEGEALPGVAEHVPLVLTGPGLSYPWRFDNTPLIAAIRQCVAATRPDRALVWPGAEDAWLASAAQIPAVLDMIDCNPLEFCEKLRFARGWDLARNIKEAAVAALHARRAVRGFGVTVCVGERDAAWTARLGGHAVQIVPNGVALPDALCSEHVEPTVVFAGTLDYSPNVDAVAFAQLQAAWVAIAPMRTGVGLKNKVLEAWACARPVVLTPLAMNGLTLPPGHHGLVQATAAGMANAVVTLLRDRPACQRLGHAARAMVARDFTWHSAAARFDALLQRSGQDR